jgi:hypothetical protein
VTRSVTTQHELTERDREVGILETAIIRAWGASGGRLPQDTLTALLVSAKVACDPVRFDAQDAADRALERLRRAAEAVQS